MFAKTINNFASKYQILDLFSYIICKAVNCQCTYVCTNASRYINQYFPIPYFVENLIILTENIAFCTSLALYKTGILLSNTSTGMQAVPKHVALWNINIHFEGGGGLLIYSCTS